MIPFFNMRTAGLGVAILAHLLQWVYYYPQLPIRVASHFNGAGEADGWTSKNNLLWVNLFFFGLMLFLAYALPWLMRFLPVSLINVPNKQFWCAAERWPVAEYRIGKAMQWLALLTYSWMVALNQLTLWTNLSPLPQRQLGPWFPILLGLYLVGMVCWIIHLYWAFRLPRDH